MIKNISAVLIVLGSLIVLSTVFTVDETEQVVIGSDNYIPLCRKCYNSSR